MKKGIFTVLIAIYSLSIFAQADINAPTLIAPADDKINQMPDVKLDWYPVSGIGEVTYSIQLSEDSLFSSSENFSTSFSSIDMENLDFGTEFFWRVQASDDNGSSDWSDVFSFETFFHLDLNAPTNEAVNQNPDALLRWKKSVGSGASLTNVSGVDHFDYQISLDSLFTDLVNDYTISADGFDGQTYFSVKSQLLPFDQMFYWRVRATHAGDESEWSDVWTFSTLATVTLTSPANEATDQMLDVKLMWNNITGIFDYIYEVALNPEFTMPVISFSDTNTVSPIGLQFGKTYYWRVSALHTVDTTDWSEVRSFETINTVYLTSPEQGENTERTPTYHWENITGITGYELRYADNEDFNSPEIYNEVDTSYFITIFPLEIGTTYFWKVRAYKTGDTTNWSEVRSFLVNPQSVNDIFTSDNVSIYPNPSNGMVNINFNAIKQSEVEVKVYDLIGKTIFNQTVNFDSGLSSQTIDLTKFNEGIYLIELSSEEDTFTGKIIINK
jgi:hypothetical protein